MRSGDGQILVDGRWREAAGGVTFPVVNPSDGEAFAAIARAGAEDVDAAVAAARGALAGEWGRMPAFERGRILARLGQLVLAQADDLAMLEARDVGKPLRQAKADALAVGGEGEGGGGGGGKVKGEEIA